MHKLKVLVTDYEYDTLKFEERILESIGAKLLKAQCNREEEVIEAAKDIDGLLVQYAPIGRKVFESLPNLKVVSRYGVGVDMIDLEAATENGVCVVNVTDYCVDEVSNHAFALLLSCARKIISLNNNVKNGNWNFAISKPIHRLKGQTLGLVGFGKISRSFAKKAKALGLKIIIFDPFVDSNVEKEFEIKIVELDELLRRSDFVSLHVPLNKDTKHLIGYCELELMKESAFLINTSRGAVIDEEALIKALKDNKIRGAALDVTEKEPLTKDSPLLNLKNNLILTPHTAWYSEEAQVELQSKAAQGVADVLTGKKPKYLVNEEVWDKFNK